MRNKKFLIIIMIILVLLCVAFFVIHFEIENTKTDYEKRVTSYLIEEKGMKKQDIKSIEAIYGVKMPPYYVVVAFEDEPYIKYVYYAHNGVQQIDYLLTEDAINIGVQKSDLKHFNPVNEIDRYIID